MTAIGARVQVAGPNGARETDFLDFYLLPGATPWKEHALESGELITHITLDAPMPKSRSRSSSCATVLLISLRWRRAR
jgi:xanthine dehydrogenase YagS FAD-binding subunit